MRFVNLFASALWASLVATTPLERRQTDVTDSPIFRSICGSSGFVRCDQSNQVGPEGSGFCCRRRGGDAGGINNCIKNSNSSLITCTDGTVARPYELDIIPSFACNVQTASPAAFTSFIGGIPTTGLGAGLFPSIPTNPSDCQAAASSLAAAEDEDGAASGLQAPTTGMLGVVAILSVWMVAAAGGAAWVLIH